MRVDLSPPRPRAGRVARRSSGPSRNPHRPRRPGCLSRPHPMFNEHCRASPLQLRTRSATIRWRGSSERSVSSSLRTSRALSVTLELKAGSIGSRRKLLGHCPATLFRILRSQAHLWVLAASRSSPRLTRLRRSASLTQRKASKMHEPVLAHRALGRPRPSVR